MSLTKNRIIYQLLDGFIHVTVQPKHRNEYLCEAGNKLFPLLLLSELIVSHKIPTNPTRRGK